MQGTPLHKYDPETCHTRQVQGTERLEKLKQQGIEEGKKEGIEQGKKEGIEQGKKEGIEEGKLTIIKNLLVSGMSQEKIKTAAGVTEEKIKQCQLI